MNLKLVSRVSYPVKTIEIATFPNGYTVGPKFLKGIGYGWVFFKEGTSLRSIGNV